jgi:hypothetical protein
VTSARRRQKEGPPTLIASRAGSTREACGNHRRTHWHIASNRSPCNPNFTSRSTTSASVGASNGTGAVLKPVVWVAGIHRNRSSQDRSESPAGGLCQPSRSSDRVHRRHGVGARLAPRFGSRRHTAERQPRFTAWVVSLCQDTPASHQKAHTLTGQSTVGMATLQTQQKSNRKLQREGRRLRRTHSKSWCFVYGLKSAPDGQFYYVGQTRCAPEMRLRWHLKMLAKNVAIGKRLTPAQAWIRDVLAVGLHPIIEVIDREGVWDVSEAVWIDRLAQAGHPLKNVLSRVPAATAEFGRELWE